MKKSPVNKEKSLIICNDDGFYRQASLLLNEVGFLGPKFQAEGLTIVEDLFAQHQVFSQVIINGADFPGDQLFNLLRDLKLDKKGFPIKALVYLQGEQMEKINPHNNEYGRHHHFLHLPLKKADFNNMLKNNRSFSAFSFTEPNKNKTQPETTTQKKPTNLTPFEASQHISKTIDYLNKLSQNPADHNAMATIAQRFNGLFGGFSFMHKQEGYREMAHLANIIDEICRHYVNREPKTAINKMHLHLLLNAAKSCFYMLKDLRENKPIDKAHYTKYNEILEIYQNHPEIERINRQSQEDIDELIDQMKVGS